MLPGVGSDNGVHAWGEHGFHLLVSLEICRCQVPRGGSEHPRRWRFTNSHPFSRVTEPVTVTGGGGSAAAGILTGDFLLRLPLDGFWPNFHLAPYAFAGFGGIILGNAGGGERSVRPLL